MPISSKYLPSELHYIIPLADKHGNDAPVAYYHRKLGRHVPYAERLSPDEIEPLRQVYTEIRDRGHAPLINGWYRGHKAVYPPETTWPVWGLLCLFRQLGNLGMAPFNDRTVIPHE